MRGDRRARWQSGRPVCALALLLTLIAGATAEAATPSSAAPVVAPAPASNIAPTSSTAPAVQPAAKPAAATPLDLELLEFLAEFSDADGFADPFVLDSTVNRSAAEALDEQIAEERRSAAKAKAPAVKAPQEDDDGR